MAPTIRLSERQKLEWLRLIRSENVGPVTFRNLINQFGSAHAALEALPEIARRSRGRLLRITTEADAMREMDALKRHGAFLVAMGEPEYPALLAHTEGAPPLIALKGNPAIAHSAVISLVGARDASAAGRRMAEILAEGLGKAGYTIASGLARGIDTAAHRASLETGTIAVLAGGLARAYPEENIPLLKEIIHKGGLVLSEMPLSHEPRARDFPRRNRIVSGLSVAVIVVEAAQRSGSLLTAKYALDQGREVMAVPGSPLDHRAGGSNRLLKQGAVIVTEVQDVLDALSTVEPAAGRHRLTQAPGSQTNERPHLKEEEAPRPLHAPVDSDRMRVMAALGPVPTTLDELARHADVSSTCLGAILLEIDLSGRLEHHRGGAVSLIAAET